MEEIFLKYGNCFKTMHLNDMQAGIEKTLTGLTSGEHNVVLGLLPPHGPASSIVNWTGLTCLLAEAPDANGLKRKAAIEVGRRGDAVLDHKNVSPGEPFTIF